MWDFLLDVNVVDGPFIVVMYGLSALVAIYLLGREASGSWVLTAIVLIIVGAMVGAGVLWAAVYVLNWFGGPVTDAAWFWIPAVFAGVFIAIWNLWFTRWWRKLVALLAIPIFALTAVFGINAAYGLNPTLGSMLNASTLRAIDPEAPDPNEADPVDPLYLTWLAPAGMPAKGAIGTVEGGIPNTNSGFPARAAQIYLPPAALVDDAPRLPLVIMMMGQPGNPDASFIAGVLDEYAAHHNGLAPIALVIDQLGDPADDPMCLNTERGNVETYVMGDVVPWALQELNVLRGRQFWTVAGYSNGGECAAYFGTKYFETFGNLLALSPDEFPGAEHSDEVLNTIFAGDQLAYDAVKPANMMAARAPYPDTMAIFTVGADDSGFGPGTQRLADAAALAGMQTTFFAVPDADHGASGLKGGLRKGFEVLYPRLGLAAPPAA
ncbi:alpha/beta hydrolase-fold protein [Agromyces albus]|uniref:alpha/beta hydrolase-fold protein n=1 Tax=Agromyces albus TaxID=205332 RepID=UPI00278076FE|nr:alpha/beta hydrolase-fold protein [Agromyces albus]MDQ0577504.1 enterochelin esterase-like enzyme [Agromyces albus]